MKQALLQARAALDALISDDRACAEIERVAGELAACLRAGNKILICGNGGSACDAAHFAEELTGRFRNDRPALAAIACTDAGHITCTANDYGFDAIFSRWIEGLGRSGDVLVALSTSGNSPNVIKAIDAATSRGIKTIALLGKGGGKLAGRCDLEWIVNGPDALHADRIQEIHMLVLHSLVRAIELRMFVAR